MSVCLCVYPYIQKSIDQLKAISASSLSLLRNESPSVASFAKMCDGNQSFVSFQTCGRRNVASVSAGG